VAQTWRGSKKVRKTLAAAITLITLCTALAIPARLAAQEQQEHNNKLPHYGVIDLGTLGGTVSVVFR